MRECRRVVVTGMGLLTSLGVGRKTILRRLFNGEGSISYLEGEEYAKIPSRVAARVPSGKAPSGFDPSSRFSSSELRTMSRATAFALAAAEEALQDAGWFPTAEEDRRRTGVAIGMGMVPLDEVVAAGMTLRQRGYGKISPFFVPKILTNLAAGHVSIRFGLLGPNHSASTACATGAHSIGDAFRFVALDDADVMVCGGTEANVNPLSIAAFSRMRALSTRFNDAPAKASRPFDANRDGFVLGEGAGVLILEEYGHAVQRGARIYAEVLGYGLSSDGHHVTAPGENGQGAYTCMEACLRSAAVSPDSVGYVNAHATSTPLGDAVEAKAIERLFGERRRTLAVSSTKGAIGHLLGAAGSVEAIFTVAACFGGVVPPTINLAKPGIGPRLNLVPNSAQDFPAVNERRIALTNSFGFGGTNASLCIASVQ